MTQAVPKRNCPNSRIDVSSPVRYLVKAGVKAGQEKPLLKAIADGSIGRGSLAYDEYIHVDKPRWPSQ